jgi:hypothetical protein
MDNIVTGEWIILYVERLSIPYQIVLR